MKKRNEDDRVAILMQRSSFLLNLFDDSRTPSPPSGVFPPSRAAVPAQTRHQGKRSMNAAIKHRPNHGRLMVVGVALTVLVPAQVASTAPQLFCRGSLVCGPVIIGFKLHTGRFNDRQPSRMRRFKSHTRQVPCDKSARGKDTHATFRPPPPCTVEHPPQACSISRSFTAALV